MEGAYVSVCLSSSSLALPELAPSRAILNSEFTIQHCSGGCRGFTGPVPPPLWIRAALCSCWRDDNRLARDCQVGSGSINARTLQPGTSVSNPPTRPTRWSMCSHALIAGSMRRLLRRRSILQATRCCHGHTLTLLKLQAGRTQDLADVQRFLAHTLLAERAPTRELVAQESPDLVEDLDTLWTLADLEFGPPANITCSRPAPSGALTVPRLGRAARRRAPGQWLPAAAPPGPARLRKCWTFPPASARAARRLRSSAGWRARSPAARPA